MNSCLPIMTGQITTKSISLWLCKRDIDHASLHFMIYCSLYCEFFTLDPGMVQADIIFTLSAGYTAYLSYEELGEYGKLIGVLLTYLCTD